MYVLILHPLWHAWPQLDVKDRWSDVKTRRTRFHLRCTIRPFWSVEIILQHNDIAGTVFAKHSYAIMLGLIENLQYKLYFRTEYCGTPVSGFRISSQTRYPDLQKSGYWVSRYRSMSGYWSSLDIECPDIESLLLHALISGLFTSRYRGIHILCSRFIKTCLLMLRYPEVR